MDLKWFVGDVRHPQLEVDGVFLHPSMIDGLHKVSTISEVRVVRSHAVEIRVSKLRAFELPMFYFPPIIIHCHWMTTESIQRWIVECVLALHPQVYGDLLLMSRDIPWMMEMMKEVPVVPERYETPNPKIVEHLHWMCERLPHHKLLEHLWKRYFIITGDELMGPMPSGVPTGHHGEGGNVLATFKSSYSRENSRGIPFEYNNLESVRTHNRHEPRPEVVLDTPPSPPRPRSTEILSYHDPSFFGGSR